MMRRASTYLLWVVPLVSIFAAFCNVAGIADPGSKPIDSVGAQSPAADDRVRPCPIVLTQIPAAASRITVEGADDYLDGELPTGARIILHACGENVESAKVLTPDFAAAGWPDVSFDGMRMLFVGRRTVGPSSVWEMVLETGELRELIRPPGDCRRAIYLSTLYTLDVDRPFDQIAFLARAVGDDVDALYTCRLDGSGMRRITFSPFGVSDPYALSDGRLLFAMPSGPEVVPPKVNLFTVHTDGSDLFPFAGIYGPPQRAQWPCETPRGAVVFVVPLGCRSPDGGGPLAAVSRTRSLRTYTPVTDGLSGCFNTPSPLPDGRLLVSHCESKEATYGIAALHPDTGAMEAVFDDPSRHDLAAQLVQPRRRPAGRSTGVNDRMATGQLYCMNSYLSDTPEGRLIPPGTIRRVRVLAPDEQRPSLALGSPVGGNDRLAATRRAITPQVIGVADVESDGSFFVEVPAGVPLRFETLDEEGRVLQAMRTWTWVMPGEERGCIGCHEDRELTPPNRHVLALRKPPQPVSLSQSNLRQAEKGESPHRKSSP